MQSDDLFLRKMRGPLARPPLSTAPPVTIGGVPSPPPSPGGAAPRQRSSSEAALGRPPEDGEGSLGGATPRTRAQSHEEAAGGGSSPTPPRFRDPLLLLGLATTESGEGGDPDSFPRPPWSPLLAHYDVQSILFDPTEPPPGPPSLISGASAAHLEPEEPPGSPGVSPDPEALVLSCPRFCCETGGEQELGLGSPRSPPGPGQLPNAAVAVLEEPPAGARPPHPIEHSDEGAEYYRKYFYGKEHQNLLGEDPRLGPVAVSLRREEKEGARPQVLHRIILRTCQARTLRGSVLEESLPPGCRPPGTRGVPTRKLLELLLPGLAVGGLRLAPSPAVQETLLKLDEQGVSRQRKVGVLYCRAGQGSEEDMYNNEEPGPALEQFLNLLGTRVRLRGFGGYRAQLDTRTDSTGTHSLYTTYHGYELMFHVSTMLPFTPSNRQQLLRKRHIGNDIVTIVFQEPGALPFSPRALRSHFQHVFIVVRVHEPCSPNTAYSVAVVRPDDAPPFGPPLEKGQLFSGGSGLRPFLLAKAINGENAAARGGRLGAMAARTRRQYLHELLRVHGGGPALPAPPRGLPTLGGLRRGGSGQGGGGGGVQGGGGGAVLGGALVWGARLEDGEGGSGLPCLLGVATERIVLVAAPAGAVAAERGVGGVGVVWNSVKTPQSPPNSARPGETPRESLVATKEGSVATGEGSLATREGLLAHREGLIAHREGSVATREGLLAHQEGSLAPREGSVATRESSVATREGSVATREGLLAHREGSLAHREGSVATREGSIAPREGLIATREGSVAPREGSVAPREGSVATREGLLAHREGLLAPKEGSVAPREGSVAPREGSVAPREGSVAPGALFSCACRDVLGWGFSEGRLEIFHGRGEWIALRLPHGAAPQVVARLQAVTRGCEAQHLALPRGAGGRRGFRVDPSGVVTAVTRFSFAETAGLRPGARLLRVGRCPLPTGDPRRLRELLRRPSGPLTLLPPDRDGRPRRSFSELYARSLQQGRGSGGDPNLGDPRGDIGDTSSDSGGDSDGGGEGGLSPQTLRLLDEERPPKSPPGPRIPSGRDPSPPPLADPTPDLLLPHHSPPPAGDPGPPPDFGTPPERPPLGRLLSGSGDPQEDEWDVIAGLATACSGVLEAIARGGHQLRELPNIGVQQSPATPEDESQSLSEKVAQLEAALKRLQGDLQEEAQQRLRSELLGLRRSARRLQRGREEPKERLSRDTRALRPPGTPESSGGTPETTGDP